MNSNLKRKEERSGMIKPGQDLVVAGTIGLTGAALAARIGEKTIRERFSAQYAERLLSLDKDLKMPEFTEDFLSELEVTDVEAAGDGGMMNSLWNLLEPYKLGCSIELRSIPIRQETVEVCEVFDLNPYRLRSGGCFLMAADNGLTSVRALEKRGLSGTVIGKVEAGAGRRILNGDIETFLDRPKPDEIEKILNQREAET